MRCVLRTLVSCITILCGLAQTAPCQNKKTEPFTPPTKKIRERAIGSTLAINRKLRKVFVPGDDFQPIRKPGPADWLANHSEPGQTVRQYIAAKPNRPDRKRHTIYLQPIGEFDPKRAPKLNDLSKLTEAYFGLNVKVLPTIPLKDLQVTSRINQGTRKKQLLSVDILQFLRQRLPRDAYCLLGITMEDLYPQASWNFVFGHASLRNRVGVYSFARYDPAFFGQKRPKDYQQLILQRSCGVLLHETTHMFGMQHCIYFECVVNGSNNLEESDSQPLHLCPVCLRKWHFITRRDPIARYRRLLKVYTQLELKPEAAWVARRLKTLGVSPAGE